MRTFESLLPWAPPLGLAAIAEILPAVQVLIYVWTGILGFLFVMSVVGGRYATNAKWALKLLFGATRASPPRASRAKKPQ